MHEGYWTQRRLTDETTGDRQVGPISKRDSPGRRQLHLHHSTHRERLTWLEGQLEFPLFSAQIVSGWVQRCRCGASPGLPITNGDRVRP